ncbi:unnamed protein product [Microthlaspi erraticum]|uniref:Uncharacterized protein n=1 Tax=Microthlaspi erraticum TaxID=1685480 RepID=A0A6D2JZA9_9BRAS|nr:unnamed protein product [Microthlaspi erraticum]CAA7047201.1 unnamed protein product [Microthlaspi erraticum]
MTWKDRKALENDKVTELGGKPQKKQRLPLSVARVEMKKQKEREEKMLEHRRVLGRFGGLVGSVSRKKPAERRKRKPEDRVLKSTQGNFKSGVLDVRHLLHSGCARTNDRDNKMSNYGMNKKEGEGGSGRKSKGNKKGGNKMKGK